MTDPIGIIADAIRDDDDMSWTPTDIAKLAATTLDHEVIVANAVAALNAGGWAGVQIGYGGTDAISDEDLANIARTVLRSVGGNRE